METALKMLCFSWVVYASQTPVHCEKDAHVEAGSASGGLGGLTTAIFRTDADNVRSCCLFRCPSACM